ncbi:hypothetical protein HDU76_013465 [Blyttiomyces sp. JEL0837]|nr:hypothetical protein HDU76_013465 [Blyttiomyces sp. JEL0837]
MAKEDPACNPNHPLTKCWQCGAPLCSPTPTCVIVGSTTADTSSHSSNSSDHDHDRDHETGGCGAVQPVPKWATFFDAFNIYGPGDVSSGNDERIGIAGVVNTRGSSSGSEGLVRQRTSDDGGVIAWWGFDLDLGELKRRYLKVQQAGHPDTHSLKSEAYQALREPLSRAKYILHLNNIHIEEKEKMEPSILTQVMLVWEEVEEAETEADLQKLKDENQARIDTTISELSRSFRAKDLEAAKKATMVLQYWVNLKNKLNDVQL